MPLTISGIHFELDDGIKKYVQTKIENLVSNLFPDEPSVSGKVFIRKSAKTKPLPFYCEVVVNLPSQTLCVRQSGVSPKAAVDLTADRLARQIRKYKTQHNQSDQRQSIRYDDV